MLIIHNCLNPSLFYLLPISISAFRLKLKALTLIILNVGHNFIGYFETEIENGERVEVEESDEQ